MARDDSDAKADGGPEDGYHYPAAHSYKAVKSLTKAIETAADEGDWDGDLGTLSAYAEAARNRLEAGDDPSFSGLVSHPQEVDYLTERIPALIVCAALVVAGALAGYLLQAILVSVLILIGTHFTVGIDNEHMISEGNRLIQELDDSIALLEKERGKQRYKKHKRDLERIDVLLYMAQGARAEIESDLTRRSAEEAR